MPGLSVKYLVKPGAGGRWDVLRGGRFTGSFARDVNAAVGLATAMASREAYESDIEVTVWLSAKTSPKKIWPA
jgi:hypothetical protein